MKKFKKIAYIILIIIIIILSLTIYTNANKNNEQDEYDKAFSEIKFLESKIVNLLNSMNNIETRNYKISYGEISKETNNGSSASNTSSDSGQNRRGK